MTVLKPLAALLLVAGLAACSTDVDEDASAGVGPGSGYGAGQLDPSSVEYFNQSIGDRVFFATDSSLLDAAAQASVPTPERSDLRAVRLAKVVRLMGRLG